MVYSISERNSVIFCPENKAEITPFSVPVLMPNLILTLPIILSC